MSIQITNDPINQFLDNLPRYALELRRQDQQRNQFNRQMVLKEKAAKNQQTLFDLTRNKQKFQSDILKEHYNAQADLRNAKREREKFVAKNQDILDKYNNPISKMTGESFEDYVKSQKKYHEFNRGIGKFFGLPTDKNQAKINNLDRILAEKAKLKDVSKIRPKEIPVPAGVEFDQSLYGFAVNNNIQKTVDDELLQLRSIFGIDGQFGVPSEFTIQQAEIERLR
jgi:hypothetical protein